MRRVLFGSGIGRSFVAIMFRAVPERWVQLLYVGCFDISHQNVQELFITIGRCLYRVEFLSRILGEFAEVLRGVEARMIGMLFNKRSKVSKVNILFYLTMSYSPSCAAALRASKWNSRQHVRLHKTDLLLLPLPIITSKYSPPSCLVLTTSAHTYS